MNTTSMPPDEILTHLLQATIAQYVSKETRIEQIISVPMTPGLSGAKMASFEDMARKSYENKVGSPLHFHDSSVTGKNVQAFVL